MNVFSEYREIQYHLNASATKAVRHLARLQFHSPKQQRALNAADRIAKPHKP